MPRVSACERKIPWSTWEEARVAGLRVYRENPLPRYANAPTPYPCPDGDHYHCGHIGGGLREQ